MAGVDLGALIRTIDGYPKPGVAFRDITTLLLDGPGFGATIEQLAEAAGPQPGLIAGIEARGFIFGAALAYRLGCGLVLLRKRNKLPGRVTGINYALEYGQDRIEMHADAVVPGTRVLLVDDLIATGGTALAGIELLLPRGRGDHRACSVRHRSAGVGRCRAAARGGNRGDGVDRFRGLVIRRARN